MPTSFPLFLSKNHYALKNHRTGPLKLSKVVSVLSIFCLVSVVFVAKMSFGLISSVFCLSFVEKLPAQPASSMPTNIPKKLTFPSVSDFSQCFILTFPTFYSDFFHCCTKMRPHSTALDSARETTEVAATCTRRGTRGYSSTQLEFSDNETCTSEEQNTEPDSDSDEDTQEKETTARDFVIRCQTHSSGKKYGCSA